ncbi:MAG: hypothetical protein FWB79_03840 [Treponema sp.]|nr:hypothetical protein [Treponema sp.]
MAGVGAIRRRAACLLLFCGGLSLAPLAASGRADADPVETVRDTWVLSVTQFDLSALSPGRRVVGEVITRSLLEKLGTVNFRLRLSPEIAFYEGYEWRRSVQATAQALARRQNDRSLLLFRGDPNWRYRRELRRIDEDIERLREELARREGERPVVNEEPVFALSQANLNNNFPPPPRPGAERRFTREQNADAFLAGEVREFHGRFFVRLRLYVLYVDAFVYEDDVIFSMDDVDWAVGEISTRLASALSGTPPARVAIRAYPPDAQILINRGYAGTGTMDAVDRPPGRVTVAVAAEGHVPKTVELDLVAGELAELDVSLGAVPMAEVTIDVPSIPGVAVYHGSLFAGETPLTLRLPIDSLAYVTLESPAGETARAVIAAPSMPGDAFDFTFRLSIPPPSGERRVNNARSRFYWAWGGLWAVGITAWLASGISNGLIAAHNHDPTMESYERALRAHNISNGALILLAPAVGYFVFELSRYLDASNRNAVRISRRNR